MMSGILDRLLLALLLCGPLPAAALELEGPLLQGGVVIGQVAPGTPVSLDGRALRVSEDGLFVIGFDRDSPQSHTLVAGAETRELAIKQREYAIQRVTGIAQNIMSPSAADLERIAREQRLVNAARGRDDPRSDFAAGFSWPILGPISGVYGSQRFYNGTPSRPHFGVDVAAPTGAPVHAPAPGIVTLAEPDLFYSGGTIIIDHGHELSSSFLHLSKVLVSVGQRVETGTLIAQVGATGRATGPHLDWRMNWRDARVDPQLLAGAMPAPPAAPAAQGDSN
ncbi:MAG: M23 family metallopeptidase [Gammaproteobacteria bacterium]|nr:M23 family metallopeptidase [Gammaproteobacteria bacterium]